MPATEEIRLNPQTWESVLAESGSYGGEIGPRCVLSRRTFNSSRILTIGEAGQENLEPPGLGVGEGLPGGSMGREGSSRHEMEMRGHHFNGGDGTESRRNGPLSRATRGSSPTSRVDN